MKHIDGEDSILSATYDRRASRTMLEAPKIIRSGVKVAQQYVVF